MTAWRLAPLYVAAAAFAIAVSLPGGDPDTYWHLASGKWMVEHGQLLRADVFSSTVSGAPYSVGEWLGELVIYGAYVLGGWAGIALLRATLIAVGAFFITRVALRAAPAPFAVAVTAIALALSEITWTDRPQLFTFALFPLVLDLLLAARAGRTRLLFVVPPLILLWTNLHGGYALGLALAATPYISAGLSEIWFRWRPASRFLLPRAGIVGVGAGLVAMVAASVATAPFAPDEKQYPIGARAKLAGTSGNLLNEYDWGG